MKRKVTIDKNGYKSTGIWGYVGEQNITDIEIVLPDELVPCDFCIAIITNAGRMELTDKLEIIDGKVNVIVPLSCTAAVGKITVQVVGYVMDESEEIYAIGKTAEFEGKIKPSSTGEMVSDSVHVPLLERIWAKIQSWTDKIHTHDNYWSISDLHCVASEAEQGGNNPFPILPDYVGVDRPTFRGNFLRYDSDGAVINKVEKKEENGSKFFRMHFNKGILDTLFNVPPFLDIPVKEINEKTEIGLNGTGLELDLGVGSGGSGDFSQFIEEVSGSVNLYPPTTEGWTNSAVLNNNGVITTNTKNNQFVTPRISVEPNTTYTVNDVFKWVTVPNFTDKSRCRAYTENGTVLTEMVFTVNADGSYTFTTPENTSYVLFCGYKKNTETIDPTIELFNTQFMLVKGTELPSEYEPFGDVKFKLKDILLPNKSVNLENVADDALSVFAQLAGKTIVNFGDSIFGNAQAPNDISTFLANKAGATVYNCGFGGCRMTTTHTTPEYNAFSMVNLADAIVSGDFTLQNNAVNSTEVALNKSIKANCARLQTIDFSKVDIITIAYASNDFKGVVLDNEDNPLDTSKFAGALRYSIEKLLTAYPNLKIFVLSAAWRFYIDENNEYTDDSNTYTNNIGLTIKDYNAKLKEVAEEYNIPYVDDYNIGIGKYNRSYYFGATDPAHHNEEGRRLIAEHLAKELY